MKNIFKGTLVFALVYGCAVNNNGAELLLTTSVVPEAPPSCGVSADSTTFISVGVIDVEDYSGTTAVPIPHNYVFSGLLTNQMTSVVNDPESFANLTQVEADANNAVIDGYYVTYEIAQDSPPPADPGKDSSLISGSKAFVDSNGAAVPAQGKAVASALILPTDIIGAMLPTVAETPATFAPFTIAAHIKADAHTQDGRRLQSNEIVFPINVCYGCLHPGCPATQVYDFSAVCDAGQDFAPSCTAPP